MTGQVILQPGADEQTSRTGGLRLAEQHVAILAPNWVGDLVMATPVLEAAQRQAGRVSILVREHLADVLRDGPLERDLVPVKGSRQVTSRLRELAPAAALLLSNSFGAAWRTFRSGVPQRAGSSLSGRGWLLTHKLHPPSKDGRRVPIPTAHLLRDVAGLFGILPENLHPMLHVGAVIEMQARNLLVQAGLGESEPYLLCCPGAAFGSAKLWPPEHFARALDELSRSTGKRAVLTCGPGEEALVSAVIERMSSAPVSLLDGERNLALLKAWVAGSELLLVGDSGPRWYAAAFDTPCVSVMGPNSPQLTASSLEFCEVVRIEDLECSPCMQRTCPLGHHRCMRDLDPSRVVRAAHEVLECKRNHFRVGV